MSHEQHHSIGPPGLPRRSPCGPGSRCLPAIAAQAPTASAITEAPGLLAIRARLPDIAARIQIARDRLDASIAAFGRLQPVVPLEIVAPEYGRRDLVELERGLNNEPIQHEGRSSRLGVCTLRDR